MGRRPGACRGIHEEVVFAYGAGLRGRRRLVVGRPGRLRAGCAPAGEDRAAGVEEVVVTARRREESLKDVPIAVSAFSAERLDATGAPDITWLQQTTPNLTLQVARGTNSTLIAFIRGVGQQDPLWGFEPGVGLYVDDVYVARPQGAVLDIYDIERLEVLRGPQGTLYGRNTIGGAIKYVTKPLGDERAARLRATWARTARHDLIASGSLPLGETFCGRRERRHLPPRRLRREPLHRARSTTTRTWTRPASAPSGTPATRSLPLGRRLCRRQLERQARPPRGPGCGPLGWRGRALPTCTTPRAGMGDDNNVETGASR